MDNEPIAIDSTEIPCIKTSIYPEPFASMMKGREKIRLGDKFGIKKFGVNLTTLAPGARSALLHRHSLQEEFIYILKKLSALENEASHFGFKWEKEEQIIAQIRSELKEIEIDLKHQSDKHKLQEEIGDLLHAAFSLCVFCQFDSEETLSKSITK